MKIKAKGPDFIEIDYTPMIDMTFQLIAFFMILINFSDAEQDQRVQLPSSTLAKPPEGAAETPITIQMLRDGRIAIGPELYADATALIPYLKTEKYMLQPRHKTE